jgi:hypothetical protein
MMPSESSHTIPVDAYQFKHSLETPGHASHLPNLSHFGPERSGSQIDELQLVHALRNGEEAAFSTLIERNHCQLLRLARSFVHTQAIAEEVVQETWWLFSWVSTSLRDVHLSKPGFSKSSSTGPRRKDNENTVICHFPMYRV